MPIGFNPLGLWGPAGRGFTQAMPAPDGRVLYLTGQVALDPDNNLIGPNDIETQYRASLDNVAALLGAYGGLLEDIVSMTTLFSHPEDLETIQRVRSEFFRTPTAPVSITYQVAGFVDPGHRVELVPVAVIPRDRYFDPARPHPQET